MMKLNRPDAPNFLAENADKWGQEWEEKQKQGIGFSWKSFEGKRVNEHLLPILRKMTQERCSFCDGFTGEQSRDTIEHFKPKSTYPKEAYQWRNLFLCCDLCQSKKGEKFDVLLLKPDDDDYRFERFFQFLPENGKIKENDSATPAEKKKARRTIEIFGLNEGRRPQSRLMQYRSLKRSILSFNKDDMPYRFIFDTL